MEHWQQYRASSHFLFEFFTPVRKGAASAVVGRAAVPGAEAKRGKVSGGEEAGVEAAVVVPQRRVSIS